MSPRALSGIHCLGTQSRVPVHPLQSALRATRSHTREHAHTHARRRHSSLALSEVETAHLGSRQHRGVLSDPPQSRTLMLTCAHTHTPVSPLLGTPTLSAQASPAGSTPGECRAPARLRPAHGSAGPGPLAFETRRHVFCLCGCATSCVCGLLGTHCEQDPALPSRAPRGPACATGGEGGSRSLRQATQQPR